jgi:hypothetical protein
MLWRLQNSYVHRSRNFYSFLCWKSSRIKSVDYLVVAGGGGGGGIMGGGGGAGGFRESVPSPAAWTASPLANPGGALPVTAQGYPITVGAGGAKFRRT